MDVYCGAPVAQSICSYSSWGPFKVLCSRFVLVTGVSYPLFILSIITLNSIPLRHHSRLLVCDSCCPRLLQMCELYPNNYLCTSKSNAHFHSSLWEPLRRFKSSSPSSRHVSHKRICFNGNDRVQWIPSDCLCVARFNVKSSVSFVWSV